MFYLIAVVMFTQMASVAGAGLVYTYNDIATFGCTENSPVRRRHPPDYYMLTTGGVTVYFPLTHVFCGEINKHNKPTGFHSTAAPQNNAQIPSAKRVGRTNQASVYNADNQQYMGPKNSTFFSPSLKVKGLSNCISMWAAECYNNNNYAGNCMYFTKIPYVNNGIQVFFGRGW